MPHDDLESSLDFQASGTQPIHKPFHTVASEQDRCLPGIHKHSLETGFMGKQLTSRYPGILTEKLVLVLQQSVLVSYTSLQQRHLREGQILLED